MNCSAESTPSVRSVGGNEKRGRRKVTGKKLIVQFVIHATTVCMNERINNKLTCHSKCSLYENGCTRNSSRYKRERNNFSC